MPLWLIPLRIRISHSNADEAKFKHCNVPSNAPERRKSELVLFQTDCAAIRYIVAVFEGSEMCSSYLMSEAPKDLWIKPGAVPYLFQVYVQGHEGSVC